MKSLEEPLEGTLCVQASLNGKHANAMAKHEMELVRHLESIISLRECQVANQREMAHRSRALDELLS